MTWTMIGVDHSSEQEKPASVSIVLDIQTFGMLVRLNEPKRQFEALNIKVERQALPVLESFNSRGLLQPTSIGPSIRVKYRLIWEYQW